MADEGASSSNPSIDEIESKRESHQSSYFSRIASMSRINANPFAIKTSTPTRSVADSTDNKESRPLLAPPTLKLGNSESLATSPPKVFLRPSALVIQTEKLKFLSKSDTADAKQEEKENFSEASNKAKHPHLEVTESNGKVSETENLAAGASAATSSNSPTQGESTFSLFSGLQSEDRSPTGGFIFGQNLRERVLHYEQEIQEKASPPPDSQANLTFEEAALQKEDLEKMEQQNQEEKLKKSLSESAKEYESRQVKRKFDEVTVITGEEEESNVLQINCKLFSFDKVTMNWQERGRGMLRLNDREFQGSLQSRVVMRTHGNLRVVLNTKVWSGMTVELPSKKTVRLTAYDPQGVKVFLVMTTPKDADQLFHALDWRVATLKNREASPLRNCSQEEASSSSSVPPFSPKGSSDGPDSTENQHFIPRETPIIIEGAPDSTDIQS